MENLLINGITYIAEKGVEKIVEAIEIPQIIEIFEPPKHDYLRRINRSGVAGTAKARTRNRELKDSTILRRITYPSSFTASSGGSLVLSNYDSDEARTLGTEFAAYADLYAQFRVKKITIQFFATTPTNEGVVAGALVPVIHDVLSLAPFWGNGPNPVSRAELLSNPDVKTVRTNQSFEMSIDSTKFLDGQLWSPTNAAMPADQIMSIYVCGNGAAVRANFTYWITNIINDVEFKSFSL